jgi:hypothetical protein
LSGQNRQMRIIENMILCKWLGVKCGHQSVADLLSGPNSVANVTA